MTLTIETETGRRIVTSMGYHSPVCARRDHTPDPCDCGLAEAVADIEDQARALEWERARVHVLARLSGPYPGRLV